MSHLGHLLAAICLLAPLSALSYASARRILRAQYGEACLLRRRRRIMLVYHRLPYGRATDLVQPLIGSATSRDDSA